MNIDRIYPILLLLIMMTAAAYAQHTSDFDPALALRLQSTLDIERQARGTVGISVAIVTPRQGSWLAVSGTSEPSVPMRPDMLLGIGSITKTFTAAAVLQLVEEGKLSLEDRIGRWLPPIANVDTTVTIRQMLAHTSGIFNYTDNDDFWTYTDSDLERHIAPADILPFIGPRRFAPGASWSYSNSNYLLLGMIIELATGNDFESEIDRRFVQHLALGSIAMGTSDELPGEIAHNWVDFTGDGVDDDITAWPRRAIYSGAWAAGGLFATAGDIARWARALYGGELLSPETIAQMTTFRNLPNGSGYGLGAMRQRVAGRSMWGHNGAIIGYYSMMLYNPQDSVAFVAIINQNGFDAEQILAEVVEEYYRTSSSVSASGTRDRHAVQSHPNPFATTTTLGYRLDRPADIVVKIFTAGGELVRSFSQGRRAAGDHSIQWDGSDATGLPVPDGAYICRIESDHGVATSMLVKIGE